MPRFDTPQGPAAPRPGVGGDPGQVQRHPAGQQPGIRRPPVRTVLSDGYLGAVHLDGVVPVVLGDAGQQPPQRGDPPGADREADLRVVAARGQLPGEIPGVGAQPRPARVPGPRRQDGQGAAQQPRPGRLRVIGAIASGQRPARSRSRPRPPRAAAPPPTRRRPTRCSARSWPSRTSPGPSTARPRCVIEKPRHYEHESRPHVAVTGARLRELIGQ